MAYFGLQFYKFQFVVGSQAKKHDDLGHGGGKFDSWHLGNKEQRKGTRYSTQDHNPCGPLICRKCALLVSQGSLKPLKLISKCNYHNLVIHFSVNSFKFLNLVSFLQYFVNSFQKCLVICKSLDCGLINLISKLSVEKVLIFPHKGFKNNRYSVIVCMVFKIIFNRDFKNMHVFILEN